MKTVKFTFCMAVTLIWVTNLSLVAQEWSQFRGSGGLNVSSDEVPIKFDDETNVAWKHELPGKGASGPIVIGDKVIVTCSGGDNQDQLYVVAFSVNSGKRLWTQKFWATGRCLCHPLSANAAPTPTSDGKQIYAFYSSNDLACLDLDGNLIWYRGLAVDRPKAGNDVGMSSSPVVHDGVVVVQIEGPGDAFVMGIDTQNGKTIWTIEREKSASWASPLLIKAESQPSRVVLQSDSLMSILDLKTGEKVFETGGQVSTIASGAFVDGKLYAPVDGTTAYQLNSQGKFDPVWNGSQARPGSASGVVHRGKMFTLNRAGVLNSFDLDTGEALEKVRVGGTYWSTPAIAGNHMYFFTQDGIARVVDLEHMEVIHEHKFEDEVFLGSPAISNGAMFIRSDKYLWKIANTDATQP